MRGGVSVRVPCGWLQVAIGSPFGVLGGVGVLCVLCGCPVVSCGVLLWGCVCVGCVFLVGWVRWFCFLLRCCMICVLVAVGC